MKHILTIILALSAILVTTIFTAAFMLALPFVLTILLIGAAADIW